MLAFLLALSWLSQSELSTFSRSREMLPGSLYLSHQMTFGAFLDDYHALVRRHDLNLPSRKIEVRKEVEASAAPASGFLETDDVMGGADFWQRHGSSRRRRSAHSSFDEPIASAMHSGLDYAQSSPPVIPMFPNGPLSTTMMDSLPIGRVAAGLTDGVSEGLGRLKRELGKVRSPKLKPTLLPATMEGSLEFDEDDELVFSADVEDVAPTSPILGSQTRPTGAGISPNSLHPLSRSSSLLTTVALSAPPTESLSTASEGWGNWGDELREANGVEYREAVEEDTKFDDMINGVLEQEAAERAATLEKQSAKASYRRADPAGRKKVKKAK